MTRRVVFVQAIFALASIAACSGSDSDDAQATSSTTRLDAGPATSSSSAPTTAAPSTSFGQGPTLPDLQSLMDRYDASVAAILADPSVAGDFAHPAVIAYLDLFVPDNDFALGALQFWAQEGAQGRAYRAGSAGTMTESVVQSIEVLDDTEAAFTVCATNSIEIVDGTGQVLESHGGTTAANAVVLSIDGDWLLRDLTQSSDAPCSPDGAGA